MVNFKQLLEKATNGTQSDPDWEVILEIVEEVKTKNVTAKNAIKEIRKRLHDNSGNVMYHTLLVLDSLMKNCASDVHVEVLCVDFLGVVKGIVTSSKGEKAVDKALELIGEWKSAFGQETGYKAINTVFSELEREGFHIPVTPVASAAFIKKAPEWLLSDRCSMCRQEFNRFKGKLRHHCRNCGKSVCTPCSTKRIFLPHFGVTEATRVCDICYKKVEKGEIDTPNMDSDLPPEYLQSSLAQESQTATSVSAGRGGGGGGSEATAQEDDDLQLALAMSLNEQENKKSAKKSSSQVSISSSAMPSAPPPSSSASTLYATIVHDSTPETQTSYPSQPQPQQSEPSNDPLARYLDRNYWEQRKEQQGSTGAPTSSSSSHSQTTKDVGPQPVVVVPQGAGVTGNPLAESVRKTIDMFMKRLNDVNVGGGSIATDPVVLSLYQNLTAMQPQLLQQIDQVQQQKAKQVAIINKLNESKEARVTLNRMRREHQEKMKQMEQEQSMLARMQMEQKLALLRQQKQEQLEFQNTLKQKRLEVLHSQRAEYEQKVAMQREMERQQLIVQEQKVLQHQFGGGGSPQPVRRTHPPPTQQYPMSMDPSFHDSAQVHDPAQPLPSKLDYNVGMDPPPYNPGQESESMYTSYQTPHTAAQPPPPPTGGFYTQLPPPSLVQGQPPPPPNMVQGQPPPPPPSMVQRQPPPPPSMVQGQPPPPSMVQGQPPPPSMGLGQPPSMLQGQPPPPSSMGPGQVVGYPAQLTGYGSMPTTQQGFSQAPPPSNGNHGNYTQTFGNSLPQQYQQEPPPHSTQSYGGYQTQYPQTSGVAPNGAHYGLPRQESESPLISFD